MRFLLAFGLLISSSLFAQSPAWVQKSNSNAQLLIDVDAKYMPESAADEGVQGLDREITVISSDFPERWRRRPSDTPFPSYRANPASVL